MLKKILRFLGIVWRTLVIVIICFLVVYDVSALVQRYAYGKSVPVIFGYASATVLSGSMEPEISTGDLVIVKSCDEYEEGDVILFYSAYGGVYVTHRIVSVTGENGNVRYTTQGDANNAADLYTPSYTDVVGKVVAVLRGAGGAVSFLQTPAGLLLIVAVCAAAWFAPSAVRKIKSGVRKHEKPDSEERDPGEGGGNDAE